MRNLPTIGVAFDLITIHIIYKLKIIINHLFIKLSSLKIHEFLKLTLISLLTLSKPVFVAENFNGPYIGIQIGYADGNIMVKNLKMMEL
jgi:hypothetical protein